MTSQSNTSGKDLQAADIHANRKADQIDFHIAARLKERRRQVGMSQRELAESLGLSYQQIQKYESGTNRISAGRLVTIAQRLEITVESLFENLPDLGQTDGETQAAPLTLKGKDGSLDALEDPKLRHAFKGLLGALLEQQGAR